MLRRWARGKRTGASGAAGLNVPVAPVIADPTARGLDQEFRLPDDEDHVVRLNQSPPTGLARKLHGFVPVAGTTHPAVAPAVEAFLDGRKRRLTLEREPTNPVAPNAIAVFGEWISAGGTARGRLGYLPAEVAAALADHPDGLGATVEVLYRPRCDKGPGIRIDIWGPRGKARKVAERAADPGIDVPRDPVARNLRGKELEAEGYVDNAIVCYEANVRDGFDGNFPFDRLAVLYRRRKEYGREVAVLERAVEVFNGLRSSPRADVLPKLQAFEARLRKARELARGDRS